MITEKNLIDLGFTGVLSPFTGKRGWTLGEVKHVDVMGSTNVVPLIHYTLDTQSCKTVGGEFTVLGRKCETEDEIIKFVECINFLLNTSVDVGYAKDYKRYCTVAGSYEEPDYTVHIEDPNENRVRLFTKEEFIEKIKTDNEFAKKWRSGKE